MIDFLDYIVSLAPKGETALILRQTPRLNNGQIEYHADGAPKATFPAFLPSHKRKDGEAWYVNTGSFVIDRFTNGKPSAKRENIEYVLFMMLDDIGTKSKVPSVPPTWIMETSEGSFQWGYAFSEQPTKGEFSAAITAIAEAGYTDPGAVNPVRNCRLPGSINLKKGRNNFPARLVEFHPGREYTLAAICEALGVTPAPADTAQITSVKIRDTGSDSVLRWLSDQGLVLSPVNAEGWCGVTCPNSHEHTDGNPEGRYSPVNRAFCCYHGHCQHLDSRAFLSWVAEQGGPKVEPGLRDDLLADRMAKVAATIKPSEIFRDTATEIIAEVERKEAGRVEKSQWYERFAYVASDDTYFDLELRREMSRGVFNAVFRHIGCKSIHNDRRIEASVCFDENRQAAGGRVLAGVTYAAGDSVLVSRDGDVYGNRWINARPDLSDVHGNDIEVWLEHAERMLPDRAEREHVFNVMAFKLQNPRIKINHAVLHGGDEGCGKDSLWAPFLWAVCGPNLRNRGLVDGKTINSRWGYALESEVMILNELKEPEAAERRALANSLKPIIAAPPDTLTIERKGLHPYDMVNRVFVLAFTNHQVSITLETQDRRWFCVWTDAPRMSEDEGKALWNWYDDGGMARVAKWLWQRDVSAFNPKATPMATEFKARLIDKSRSMAETYIMEQIERPSPEFAAGVIASPVHRICTALQHGSPNGAKIVPAALYHALKEAGWEDLGMVKSTDYPTKKNMWARPDMLKRYNKSELRRMVEPAPAVEQAPEPGLKLVKS
jgi:hypothetical protein